MVQRAIVSASSTTLLHFIITAQDISVEVFNCGKTAATTEMLRACDSEFSRVVSHKLCTYKEKNVV